MNQQTPFADGAEYRAASKVTASGIEMAEYFAEAAAEYGAARNELVVFDRSDRGLVVARGAERKSWLHNMVTNAVNNLEDNTGSYAFAIDNRGRTQFDLNILVVGDELWLDIDAAYVGRAVEHLSRFIIMEDVELRDATGDSARLGFTGALAKVADAARQLGAAQFPAMASLSSTAVSDGARLVRHDFAGAPGLELLMPRAAAAAWWSRAVGNLHAVPAGFATLDLLRIEAGIPWLGRDIDESTIPLETGQIERGISFHKGCYLGQEIIERMRSRGAAARRLVKLRIESGADVALPATLIKDRKEVGRVTSLVRHPVEPYCVGLGYLRTSVTDLSGVTTAEPVAPVQIL